MLNFHGITHVMANPTGHAPGYNYSLVGAVPVSMLEPRQPTAADIMAGRVQPDGLAYRGRKWERVEDIITAAAQHRVSLCSSPTCACRQLF
jgi:hypothetical protein